MLNIRFHKVKHFSSTRPFYIDNEVRNYVEAIVNKCNYISQLKLKLQDCKSILDQYINSSLMQDEVLSFSSYVINYINSLHSNGYINYSAQDLEK